MKKLFLAGGLAAFALALAVWGIRTWQDTHPRYEITVHALKAGYSIELPASWPKPGGEAEFIVIENSPDSREGSFDQFRQRISIHDYGTNVDAEKVIQEMRSGYDTATRVSAAVLANGIVAKTWTFWEPMGELNQEHRGYVFKAPNGRIYSVLEPMARDWRTKRRYDNLFRAVLGSMKFKL
jgi:hypothetical protein